MRQLNKSMGFSDLVVMGLLFISPMAPVGLFGVLDALSDGAIVLVYLVATLVMGFTAFSYARMTKEFPSAGAVYTYCSAGIHPKAGFLIGWLLLLDYMFIPAVAYLFTGISLHSIMPSIPIWVWITGAVVVTVGLNLIGTKKSAKVSMVMLIIEMIILVLVLALGIYYLCSHGSQRSLLEPFTGGMSFKWSHLFTAVSIAVLSYLGFDAIATFAEENSGKRSIVSKAILTCLVLVGVLFMLQTYVGALLSPMTPSFLREHPDLQGSAYYSIINTQLGAWLGISLAVMKGIGAAFAAMVGQAAAGRLLFSMSRDGCLPKILSKVGTNSGVPTVALLFTAAFNMCLAACAGMHDNGLETLVSFVDIGALVAFIMLHVAVIGYFKFKKKQTGLKSAFSNIIVPIIGIVILLPVLCNIKHSALIVGFAWLVIGVIVLVINRGKINLACLNK